MWYEFRIIAFGRDFGLCKKRAKIYNLVWAKFEIMQKSHNHVWAKFSIMLNPLLVTTYDGETRPALRNPFDTNDLQRRNRGTL